MKRIILTIAMSFMLLFTANAENNSTNNTEAYSITVNTERLANALGANEDQKECIDNIMGIFSAQLENTKFEVSDSARNRMLDNTVDMNINYMRQVLNPTQYRKYLTILNSTLNNRGLR